MHMEEYVDLKLKEVLEYLDKFKQQVCVTQLEELAKF